ncbi:hypothetical protein ACLB2K_020676 [Fragaria x ananassa]
MLGKSPISHELFLRATSHPGRIFECCQWSHKEKKMTGQWVESVSFQQLHEHKIFTVSVVENCNDDQITCLGSVGCWQSPPQDVMEEILQKMGLIARTRLTNVCMSWSSLVTRADIRSAPHLPWLVHPQTLNTNYLTFSSLSEGELVNLDLPTAKRFRGHGKFKFQASSKGWLILLQEKGLISNFDMFLYNPISRAQHQLPSLNTIPSFLSFRLATMLSKWKGINIHAEYFVTKVVCSSPHISECIVAAVIQPHTVLALCRPGNKSWTVIEILNPDEDDESRSLVDLIFSNGRLYGLVDNCDESNKNGIGAARILNFGDDQTMTVELKLVYGHKEIGNMITENHDDYQLFLNGDFNSYLAESATNRDKEILLIHQRFDCLLDLVHDDLDIEYKRTRGFAVYKIDLVSGKFQEVKNLGDQIIFLAEHSSSFAFAASDFKLQGNCIYFATSGYEHANLPSKFSLGQDISREMGIYSLDDGKFIREDFGVCLAREGMLSTPTLKCRSPSVLHPPTPTTARLYPADDSSNVPNHFPSPASLLFSSFPARSPKTSNKIDLA